MSRTDDFVNAIKPLSWRGIVFPFSELTTEFTQKGPEHEPADVDGADIELTGRGARVINGRAIFRNGLVFEKSKDNRAWFPDVYRDFEKACADRTTGTLVHPTRGEMKCKLISYKETITAAARDGVDIDMQWKETGTTNDILEATTRAKSSIGMAETAAALLDKEATRRAMLAAWAAKGIQKPFPLDEEFSFSDAVRTVKAATDTASLIKRQAGNSIAAIQQQAAVLEGALARIGDVAFNAHRAAISRLQSSLDVWSRTRTEKTTMVFLVRRPMTMANLARVLDRSVLDLVRLNPSLAGVCTIPAETSVIYPRTVTASTRTF